MTAMREQDEALSVMREAIQAYNAACRHTHLIAEEMGLDDE